MLDQFRDLIFLGIKRGPHLGGLKSLQRSDEGRCIQRQG